MKIHILGLNVENFFIYDRWYMGPSTGTRRKCHFSGFEKLSLQNFYLFFFFFFSPLREKGNERQRDSGMMDHFPWRFPCFGGNSLHTEQRPLPGILQAVN